VQLANALPAEDARVLAAVEVLDALLVLLTHVGQNLVVGRQVFGLKALVEVDVGEQGVLRHDFVQNVEVEGQFVD